MATNMLDQVTDEQERLDLMHAYEELNLKDAQRLFTSLTERCFKKCVTSFRNRQLDSGEMKCINNCAEKYLAHVTRVGARFTEENMKSQAGLQ